MSYYGLCRICIKLLIIAVLGFGLISCAESDDGYDPPPQDHYDYDLIDDLDLDYHYENELGIDGAREYGTGEPPYMMKIYYPDSPVACFYTDTEDGRVTGALRVPWQWTSVFLVQNLELILAMTYESEATGREALYEHGTVEVYHVTVFCELREATTMEIVTTESFEGNNAFPSYVVWGATMVDDDVNSQVVEDWLRPYVDPS